MQGGPFVGVGAEVGDLAGMGEREEMKGTAVDDQRVKLAVGGGGLTVVGDLLLSVIAIISLLICVSKSSAIDVGNDG